MTKTAHIAYSIPAVHALHLAQVLERWGVGEGNLLGCIGRTPAELKRPQARLTIAEVERLVERAIELSGEPGLGFHLGLSMRVSAHGHLGFAAMTAGNVRQALELAIEYAPTRTRALSLRLEDYDAQRVAVVLEERADLGRARGTVITALLVGIWQIAQALTGQQLAGHAEVAFDKPAYYARFAPFVQGMVRFDCDENRLVFAADVLELPLVMSDDAALELAVTHCRQELDTQANTSPVTLSIEALLDPSGEPPTLVEVAKRLHVSPRTLKRRLADEGVTYSQLRDAHRRRAAQRLLKTDLSIEQIARRLGYAEPASFSRAFRRWTGVTPRHFRTAQ